MNNYFWNLLKHAKIQHSTEKQMKIVAFNA